MFQTIIKIGSQQCTWVFKVTSFGTHFCDLFRAGSSDLHLGNQKVDHFEEAGIYYHHSICIYNVTYIYIYNYIIHICPPLQDIQDIRNPTVWKKQKNEHLLGSQTISFSHSLSAAGCYIFHLSCHNTREELTAGTWEYTPGKSGSY